VVNRHATLKILTLTINHRPKLLTNNVPHQLKNIPINIRHPLTRQTLNPQIIPKRAFKLQICKSNTYNTKLMPTSKFNIDVLVLVTARTVILVLLELLGGVYFGAAHCRWWTLNLGFYIIKFKCEVIGVWCGILLNLNAR
jgi:hypothetical protein